MGVSRSLELLVSKHVINQHRTLTSLLATMLLVLCPAAWPAGGGRAGVLLRDPKASSTTYTTTTTLVEK